MGVSSLLRTCLRIPGGQPQAPADLQQTPESTGPLLRSAELASYLFLGAFYLAPKSCSPLPPQMSPHLFAFGGVCRWAQL